MVRENSIDKVKRTVFILRHALPFIILLTALASIGITIGPGFISTVGYWFILVPVITYLVCNALYKSKLKFYHLAINLLVYYGFVIFMIYKHYQSDVFQVMIYSMAWNLVLFGIYFLYKRLDKITLRG